MTDANHAKTRGTVIFGYWQGFAIRDDGAFRFEETKDGWKVWRWADRWRRIKKWPADLLDFGHGPYEV